MPRRFTRLLDGLPATTPFVPPEAIERRVGRAFTARLGANESAFGPSPRALLAMQRALETIAWYGDPDSHELRQRLAGLLGTDAAHLSVGAGIDDLLELLVRAFVEEGEAVVCSHGCYPTFAYHVRAHGAELVPVPYRDFKSDLDALLSAARERSARILFLANPDNPTGSLLEPADVAALTERLSPGCVLLLDEAYADFVAPERLPRLAPDDPRVVRVRTFSKGHGLAGARIGYAVGAPEVIAALDKMRNHFGVNRVGQAGALASLEDPGFIAGVVAAVDEGRQEYAALGAELGLAALPSSTNFVSYDIGGGAAARALLEGLRDRGVFVRTGVGPLDRLLRVTIGAPDDRARFAAALRELRAG